MTTERLHDIAPAAQILQAGGTVAFPTETVYGLGPNALAPAAVEKIFAAKQRPHWDPLIVHIATRSMLDQVATVTPASEALVNRLIEAFWPGPLTLLLPRTPQIPDAVTAGRPLVGVRMPGHPIAHALLEAAGLPIAAPSANRFGHTSPTTAAHALEDLDGRIDAVLDGGPPTVGLESTVFDPIARIIYRPGAATPAMLEPFTGPVTLYQPPIASTAPEALPSPGVGIRHYAPRARLLLVETTDPITLRRAAESAIPFGGRVGFLLPSGWPSLLSGAFVFDWGDWGDRQALARNL